MIVTSDRPTHTARQAAEAHGVELGAICKSMVFLLDEDPVLFLVSGAHNVDLAATGPRVGGVLTRASIADAEHATGQPVGSVAPVGHPTNLPTFVDSALAEHPTLWAAAGDPGTMFRTSYSEALRITAGLAVEVGG